MQNTIRFCFAALALSAAVGAQAARPLEFTVGTEYYNETYREYEGSERLMQQTGNLWSLTGGVKYRFNDRHAAKVEGRYSRGKSDYTGGVQDADDNFSGYGSATLNGSPRRVHDIRALYEYTHPINDRFSVTAGAGLGHRVLRDLNSRVQADDYDRKNQTTYAQINAGVNIALPANFEVSPRIAYNHALRGRQYSYHPGREATERIQNKRRSVLPRLESQKIGYGNCLSASRDVWLHRTQKLYPRSRCESPILVLIRRTKHSNHFRRPCSTIGRLKFLTLPKSCTCSNTCKPKAMLRRKPEPSVIGNI